jgi:CheY-like chemotaxis protein/HPt (histidine-containing phosphotransfer) domain-containing protein
MKDVNLLKSNGVNVDQSLELFGDMETYDETLEEFLSGVGEKLSNIEKYKEASDMANYAILVHSLKSDSKYLGFTTLAELSYNHEMASKANNVEYVYSNYDSLIKEANRIVKLAASYLGKEVTVKEVEKVVSPDAKTILVVDDSSLIRTFIQKIFNGTYNVLIANDGREALNIINQNNNIVGMLLDLNMTNVNGFEVLDYFKQNSLFAKIPVSIITGEDSKENVERAFTYPIADVLAKPFNERDVKRVVEKTIEYR